MRTSLLILALLLYLGSVSAQSAKEEMDYIQSIFGMEKKALVAEVVQPNEATTNTFWTL